MAETPRPGRVVNLMMLSVFVDTLSLGLVIPIFPLLFASTHSPYSLFRPGQERLGLFMLGLNEAVLGACVFFAAPVLGGLADRWGRKRTLLLSLTGTVASYVLLTLAILHRSLPLLLLARAVDGLTGGNGTIPQSAVADVTPKGERRIRTFARFDAAISAGYVIGPLLGGFLSDPRTGRGLNPSVPMAISAVVALVNLLAVALLFEETLREPRKDEPVSLGGAFASVRAAFEDGRLRGAYVTNLLYSAGFAFFTTFFSVFLQSRLDFGGRELGIVFTVLGLLSMAVQLTLVHRTRERFGAAVVVPYALVGTGTVFLLSAFGHSVLYLALLMPFYSAFSALVKPNLDAIVSERVDEDDQGRVLGVNGSVQSIGSVAPPVVAGGLAALLGPGLPIVVGGAVTLLAFVAFRRLVVPSLAEETAAAA